MYSQCPDCQTRFRVTAEVLRAARGTVRCGRCGCAFDALARLSDTIPPAAQDQPPVPLLVAIDAAAAPQPSASAEYRFTAEDLERVFVEAGKWHDPFLSPAPVEAEAERPAVGVEPHIVVVDGRPGIEDITLEGEQVSIEAPPEPAEEVVDDLDSTNKLEILRHVPDSAYPEDDEASGREPAASAPSTRQDAAPAVEMPTEPVAAAAEPAAEAAEAEPVAAPVGVEEPAAATRPAEEEEPVPLAAQRWRRPAEESEPVPAAAASPWGTVAWTLASLTLALVLAVQLVHYFRQDLARHPQVGPPLRIAYERLGLELQPHWDLAAIELRQWGNDANAAAQGSMVVRASLTNRAAFAQPHPILRLELEDRFGATVATRDFEPADYLKNPSQATRLIAPGSSSEAELLLADPGRDAVGYRLDLCLRESASHLRCASGPG
jgi:predicted Zn finger-like uncharacterized protein